MLGNFTNIEILMSAKGLSRSKMAKHVGISSRGMARILKQIERQRNVRPATLGLVAQSLECEIEMILSPSISPPTNPSLKPAVIGLGLSDQANQS
jgi:DNA-binding Xre family transcriptional regulator